jgi:predicted Rossmann fold nucleotide-binding protein DprA/Smf involved in DNA uptake
MAREKVAEIGAEVVAAIEKIEQEAAEKKRKHIDTLKDAIKVARLEVRAAEDKVASLEALLGILTGKPVQSSRSSGGKRSADAQDMEAVLKVLGKDGKNVFTIAEETDLSRPVITAALKSLRKEGKAKHEGKGRGTVWLKA